MKLKEIEELIEEYGFDFILRQFDLNQLEVLSILDELGYINLDFVKGEE
jgi:hypothetical protein